jgi:hypothetical protein
MTPHPYTRFKEGHEKELVEEFSKIRPRLQIVLDECAAFCQAAGQEFVITDLLSNPAEDKLLGRVSESHSEGRAGDIRVKNWPDSFQKKFAEFFDARFVRWAAISKKTGKPKLIVIHNIGHGAHCHIQIRPYKEA